MSLSCSEMKLLGLCLAELFPAVINLIRRWNCPGGNYGLQCLTHALIHTHLLKKRFWELTRFPFLLHPLLQTTPNYTSVHSLFQDVDLLEVIESGEFIYLKCHQLKHLTRSSDYLYNKSSHIKWILQILHTSKEHPLSYPSCSGLMWVCKP